MILDLDDIERAGRRLIDAIGAADAVRLEGSLEALHEMALARQEYDRAIAGRQIDSPHFVVAVAQYIRELRAGLADALYWLKPGLAEKRAEEVARDRAELSKLLDKEIDIP